MKRSDQISSEIFPEGVPLRSKWLRVKQVLDAYPVKMTRLYELINSRRVRSFVFKDKGAIRGIRLIDRDSLDLFFEMSARQAEDERAAGQADDEEENPPTV